ncbi:MAG: LPS assembly lipoprotein LptE [Bacteroidales bacterium]|nr:LPS assembly lipoprotein LptE [Bacteroidales bacterium]
MAARLKYRKMAGLLIWLLPLLAVLLAGCKGGYSFTGASIPPEAKTISVAAFPNYASTVNPQLSQKLTDELRNLYASQTSLNVVNADGDLQVSGEITGYSTRTATVSSQDEAAMNRFTITIKVKFVNEADPKADFEQSFSRYKDYNASQDFSSVENSLVGQIVTELAEDVFNKSVVNW